MIITTTTTFNMTSDANTTATTSTTTTTTTTTTISTFDMTNAPTTLPQPFNDYGFGGQLSTLTLRSLSQPGLQ